MPLTDPDLVKQWANPKMDSSRDDELDLACVAATAWVKRAALWEVEETAYTLNLDGCDAIGPSNNVLLVPPRYRPVTHSTTPVTITEDGAALSVTAAYDATKDVYLVGADRNARLELIKPASPWISGYANIQVAFTAGYAAADVPQDIVQLASEVALLMFRAGNFTGKASKTGRGGTISYEKDLSPASAATLERMRFASEAI